MIGQSFTPRPDRFDPEALDAALAHLADAATATRDCFTMGDVDEGRRTFDKAITALAQAVHQISLLNR